MSTFTDMSKTVQFFERRIFSVKWKDLAILIGVYTVFAWIYHLTLWINRGGYKKPDENLFDVVGFMDDGGLQYVIQFIFSAVVWYIIFRAFRSVKLWKRLLIHVFLLPIWVVLCKSVYYSMCEVFCFYHLKGEGQ
ncbi:MAG: hypothetical protein AAF193_03745, partial [Bacteroidota bacterium]